MIGFIILRHIRTVLHNEIWQECYNCIRKLYPKHQIIIIDDNSYNGFISELKDDNLEIINSEYPGKGELLPYYYYLRNYKKFDIAVILHDSTFINRYIDFNKVNQCLWTFKSFKGKTKNSESEEKNMINNLSDSEKLLKLYNNKNEWNGCFGSMSVIQIDFLKMINDKYNILNLLPLIKTRNDRMRLERIFGLIMTYENKKNSSVLGDIHGYFKYNYSTKDETWILYNFQKYKKDKLHDLEEEAKQVFNPSYKPNYILPVVSVIKVLTGR